MRFSLLAVVLAASALAVSVLEGCATRTPSQAPAPSVAPNPKPEPAREPKAPPKLHPERAPAALPLGFADLEGWAQDDHAAAFAAFVSNCAVAREMALAIVCQRATVAGRLDEPGARRFLEANFRPERLPDTGLLTAYYTPVYEARSRSGGEFTSPLRPRPADLPRQRSDGGTGQVYPDRSDIEARPAGDALAWMRPEDLFFLQIQGSGVLTFPDGVRLRAVFDGANGAPFLGIAASMRREGLLADQDTSSEKIHTWLAAHRGPEAASVMRLNRRYVFFHLQPDDGAEPSGAAGVRLTPGRALAMDLTRHAFGEAFWVDATSPVLSGAFPNYRRMAMVLDTGGAIKGDVRADLYMGVGPLAGSEAGRVRHLLRLFRLTPLIEAAP